MNTMPLHLGSNRTGSREECRESRDDRGNQRPKLFGAEKCKNFFHL